MTASLFSTLEQEAKIRNWRTASNTSTEIKSRFPSPMCDPLEDLRIFAEDALSKALRPLMRKKTHKFFLSQGFFKVLAKELGKEGYSIKCVESPSELDGAEVSAGDVILICGSDAELVVGQTSGYSNNFIFAQNLNSRITSKLRPLPIGVEDLAYFRNGIPINLRPQRGKGPKLDRVLVGPFRPTNPIRKEIIAVASDLANCDVIERRLSSFTFARVSSRYNFVACPPGNGLDTHRMWETLYRGSIPVLIDSPFARNWLALGAPVIILKKWEDLSKLTIADVGVSGGFSICDPNLWRNWIVSPSVEFENLAEAKGIPKRGLPWNSDFLIE